MIDAKVPIFLASDVNIPLELPKLSVISIVLTTFAVILLLEIFIYVFLYHKPRIDEALVRTGAGGVKVGIGHGLLKVPFLHKIKTVSLNEHTLCFKFRKVVYQQFWLIFVL